MSLWDQELFVERLEKELDQNCIREIDIDSPQCSNNAILQIFDKLTYMLKEKNIGDNNPLRKLTLSDFDEDFELDEEVMAAFTNACRGVSVLKLEDMHNIEEGPSRKALNSLISTIVADDTLEKLVIRKYVKNSNNNLIDWLSMIVSPADDNEEEELLENNEDDRSEVRLC